ncbi:hypothetical protein DL96DRAFT_543333 [Flagelloscypha sp. PMI_526]|nr:hypothetical protein DL96DRAFT_543333 [Flagelloscypha sp. PMI_526]
MAHSTTNTATRGLTLLSLDSGRFENMTCLSQLFILRENIRTFEIDNDRVHDSVKVHEVFDLIVGTGSGGLVACLVGPLNMLVSEAIEAYIRIHTAVFIPDEKAVLPEERTRRLRKALRALIEEKLAPEHQVADFSDFTRVIPDCKIVITALPNVHVEAPIPFRSFRGRRVSPPPCTLLEAILCTLAHARLFTDVSLCEGSITQSFIAADLGKHQFH